MAFPQAPWLRGRLPPVTAPHLTAFQRVYPNKCADHCFGLHPLVDFSEQLLPHLVPFLSSIYFFQIPLNTFYSLSVRGSGAAFRFFLISRISQPAFFPLYGGLYLSRLSVLPCCGLKFLSSPFLFPHCASSSFAKVFSPQENGSLYFFQDPRFVIGPQSPSTASLLLVLDQAPAFCLSFPPDVDFFPLICSHTNGYWNNPALV